MNWRKMLSLIGLLVLLLAAVPMGAIAAPRASDPLAKVEALVLQELTLQGQTDYFIWMTAKADLTPAYALKTKLEKGQFVYETLVATAERTQKDLRAYLDKAGVAYQAFYIANKILVYGGSYDVLVQVAARPDVAQVTANHKVQIEEPFRNDDPGQTAAVETNITFIKAPQVWALGYTGQGTVMAGNDTGLDWDHPALIRQYRGCLNPPTCSSVDHNYNWWDATDTYPTVPGDGHGHGTHTSGTMVGEDASLTNQIGVAPDARLVHCKNMNNSGSGSEATFTECFQWDLAPWDLNQQNANPALAPDAVNNSWGHSGGNQNQYRDEILALHAAGILIEVSSGNEGSGCASLRSPGDYTEVLTTGSVNHASSFPGTMTGFSSRGPSDLDGNYFPDITAPGENIRSSVPGGTYEGGWSGTSMAGPHATALVGLMWSACPAFRGMVEETIAIITDTASPVTSYVGSCGGNYVTGPNNDWGYGTIDALAAVNAILGLCAEQGALHGHVYDAATLAPLADATVTAQWDQGGQWADTTDTAGYYTLTVPNGTYTVTGTLFGYDDEVVTGVPVITDQVTTQDLYLEPSAEYVVSGTVTEAGTGVPLFAQVEALGTPLAPVWTNPGTGFYAITVPEGTYTFRVTAAQHQPEERAVVVDSDQTQNYVLEPLPCILLVDDDNNAPNTAPYFTAALDTLGYDYDLFDTAGGSGPTAAELAGYGVVIWFSGDAYGGTAGPNSSDESNLASYLDDGGHLFLSSQDYLYDQDLTPFGQTYLGIGSYTNDSGNATTKYGVSGDPIGGGLGPYALTYPSGFTDYGDIVNAGSGASVAFRSASSGGNALDIDKDGGNWQTVFFGTDWVPIYNNNAANGRQVLDRILTWFDGCASCEAPSNAAFTWTPPAPYAGEAVTFTATVSGTAPFLFEWAFGDGGAGVGSPTAHTYAAAGDYTVVLTATNACGVDQTSALVTILTPPCDPVSIVDVTVDVSLLAVTLTSEVTGTAPFDYLWDFGDGDTSTDPHPVHTYAAGGCYTVTLDVTNGCGADHWEELVCVCDPVAIVDVTVDVSLLTVTLTSAVTGTAPYDYLWAFGDGDTSTDPHPVHAYAAGGCYTVTLDVTNGCGADHWEELVCVCDPVSGADFSWTPPTPLVGEEVLFTGTAGGTAPIDYAWSLGDGGTGTGISVTHAYTAAGTYLVMMTATNSCGQQSVTHDVVVAGSCVEPAGADFSWTPVTPTAGADVDFHGSVEAGTAPLTYTWEFSDGGTAGGQDVTHAFADAGTYVVTMTAANECGEDIAVHTVVVAGVCVPPSGAAFTWLPTTPAVGQEVAFDGSAAGDPPLDLAWDFGDGALGAGAAVTHTYAATGTYVVWLTATNACGEDSVSHPVTVVAEPVCTAVEIVTTTAAIDGCTVHLAAQLAGDPPFTYLWTLGDGVTSTASLPSHTYAASGTYHVTLEVWNCEEGHDTAALDVTVACGVPPASYFIYLPLIVK